MTDMGINEIKRARKIISRLIKRLSKTTQCDTRASANAIKEGKKFLKDTSRTQYL